jgi:Flp pilus assembly protein TadD
VVFFRVDFADLHVALAQCAAMTGDEEKAERYARRAFEHCPEDPGVLNNLAVALIRRGRAEEAEEYLERALRLDPGNGTILGNLLQLLVEEGKIDRAKSYLVRLRENLG